MKKIKIHSIFLAFLFLISCQTQQKQITPEATFGKYVQAFTSGVISTGSTISVILTQPVSGVENTNKQLFRFSPEIKGETVVVNDRLIEFRPSQPLRSGTIYSAEFLLGDIMETEAKLKKMPFQFSTIKQSFSVYFDGLRNYEGGLYKKMQLSGHLLTADIASFTETEKILKASFNEKEVVINWIHETDRRKHFFTIDSLERQAEKTVELNIEWNGNPLDVEIQGKEKFEVPALNGFSILTTKVIYEPQQHIEIRFSDPLLKTQDLTGLLSLADGTGLRLQPEDNVLKAWPANPLTGEIDLSVHEGIQNINYKKLQKTETFRLQFTSIKPAVRFIGNGNIVPQSGNLEMPFEAVNLSAVEIRVVEIFKDNVLTFFQENQWEGNLELKKVGRLVYLGEVALTPEQPGDLERWSTYRINLAKFFKIEQGAIYHVQIRFNQEHSLFSCGEKKKEKALKETEIKSAEPYQTEWDQPGWYSDYFYPEGFNWQERDNPCQVSYYTSQRFASRNIFASELGIIAKEGRNHEMKFVVTNLLTTNPEPNVEMRLFNYQNQLIETIVTDKQGFATVQLQKKPFMLIAKKGNQFGYLRLDDGTSLSTSNFDVSGEIITDGLKGFIYGERGVWRPGDTLFLNFIVEKEIAGLPDDFPVIFQLMNPGGQMVERRVLTENVNGFYSIKTKTASDALTGNWLAEVKVGNAIFSKRIKIETVKPNRLKVELGLPKTALTQKTKNIPLESAWLYGSPARSLKTKVDVLFVKDKTVFEGFEKYSFNNPASVFEPTEQTIFEGRLDANGKTTIPLDFKSLENAPGMVKTWFTTRVFEEGGDFSINVAQAKFAPYHTFVGVKMPASEDNWYKTGTEYSPEIVLVDAGGKPVSGSNLQVKLYKIDWRWWWESGDENLAHYVSGKYYKPVSTWNISNAEHKSYIKLNVKYRNWQDNGRYFLWVKDVSGGHATGVTFYMSEWGGWRSDGIADGATLLTLRTDKEKYNVGEKIEVTIPSSSAGKALVSLENGTTVTDFFWVETQENQTRFFIDVKPEMAPNFYIYVTLIQPYGQTVNDAPLRLYGVAPVLVENPETILNPVIETPSEIEPEQKYTIKVSEANKKEMTYTLAIVDDGLLGLTNFRTPEPHSAFYTREALGVKTWDLYDFVAGAYGARLEKAFAVGGDSELSPSGKKEVNRFKPVVQFAGPFTVKKGQTGKHTFTMANYVGSVRVMVVAGNNGAYGNAEKTVPVRKGLMLLATLPRVLAPGEEVSIPVNVFAMKENIKNVNVSVKTNDLTQLTGETHKNAIFSKTGDQVVYFKLKAKSKTGIAKIEIEATSGSEKASTDVELEIRNPNQPVTVEQSAMVEGKKSWSATLQVPGEPAVAEAWVEISGLPSLNLSKHLDYLISYPHGCIEQVVSGGFPQLFLNDLTQLSANQQQETEDNIREVLQKLPAFQLPGGGFAYWPGSAVASDWGTSYAGHFMLKAEMEGFSLPSGLKDKWLNFQRITARNWSASESVINHQNFDFIQAYRLYTLALAGAPDLGSMNRLREKSGKSPEVSWRLAAAYVLAGQAEAARQLVNNATTIVDDYNEPGGTFGSALRDKAMILETLVLMKEKEKAFKMLQTISDEMNREDWLSTQTAAWCLSSAAQFAREYFKGNTETRFEMVVNGEKTSLRSEIPVLKIPVKIKADGKVQVEYVNQGETPAFVNVLARGIPVGIDSTSASNYLLMNLKYTDAAGNEINPQSLKQGEDFRMAVTVKNPGTTRDYEEMVLNTVFPSGWEVLNNRMNDIPQNQNSTFDYQDIRDDRVYTYFDLRMNEQKTFVFYLNASYSGRFYQPPVSCEAMYDFSIRAQKPGRWVSVDGEK
jgi:alpha-2-macroglobulin